MDVRNNTAMVKQTACELGFDRCGIARATPIGRAGYFHRWLQSGRAGTMEYLYKHAELRTDPGKLLEGAKSVVVVALSYNQPSPPPPDNGGPFGRVAMYAWGNDYHKVVKKKLFALADRLHETIQEPFESKACVDTAPLLERELAAAAGVGWIGKNTMALDAELGSHLFLGALVTTLDLEPDEPAIDHCGTCTACLDACPTQAFPKPYEMDATRCISYLTIEHRSSIDDALQLKMGDWIFGCDVCQEVCPHNRTAPVTAEPRFAIRPPGPYVSLDEVENWSEQDYAEQLRGSAMKRASLDMLRRNTAIVKRTQSPTSRSESRDAE
jgi:epoxyqueuosine reductase